MSRAVSTSVLDAAVEYHDLGMSVIPVRGKKPAIGEWKPYQAERADRDLIELWFGDPRITGIAIVTGAISNLVVLDADTKHHPTEGIRNLVRLGTTALTPLVRTGRGGYHQFFRHPGVSIRSRSRLLPSLDVRADGGYVVAPPSVHPDTGRCYEWLTPLSFVARVPIPDAVLALLLAEPRRTTRDQAGPVAEGERNDWLYRHGRLLASNGATGDELIRALATANQERCVPPLDHDEVLLIASSIERYVPVGVDAEIRRLRCLWAAHQWRLDSDRLAVQVAHDIGASCGKLTIALGVRTVAEQIGVNDETADKAIHRITHDGWLQIHRLAYGTDATVYRLTVPHSVRKLSSLYALPHTPASTTEDCTGTPTTASRECAEAPTSDARRVLVRALAYKHRHHDVWRRRALGKPCMLCYAVLLAAEGMSERHLAKLLDRKNVRPHLGRLRQSGLAKLSAGIWRAVPVWLARLDEIPDEFGTLGVSARQKKRHAKERQANAERLRTRARQ